MPLYFSKPAENFKKINEEVFKRDVSRNDDDRELAESLEQSDQVDILLNSLQEVEGFAIDFANKLSNAGIAGFGEVPPIGKFLTSIANAEKETLVLDINSISRNSIDSIQAKKEKLEQILESLDVQTQGEWTRINNQVKSSITNLLGNLKIKLVNYKQTVPVEGVVEMVGGYFPLNQYQPRRYV
jgi:hypothetical protein